MFALLPLRTSIYPRKSPYANYLLIAANLVVFLLSMHLVLDPRSGHRVLALRDWTDPFKLIPGHPYIWQFVTYAFLHGGLWHILGNMYFLYLFGNNVNDKLGNIGYVCFYLAGAVFSGIGQCLLTYTSVPTVGASGAIAAVIGAYLVLFPKTLIDTLYWFIYIIGRIEIRAIYLIGFKLIVWDNIIAADPTQGIAYNAHLAGYGFGIFATLGLLAIGLIPKDFNDLWSMLRQWNRRRHFRDVVAGGYDPYSVTGQKTAASRVSGESKPLTERQKEIAELRSRISEAMRNRDSGRAARLYLELVEMDESQILPRQLQLDIANQLMSEGKWPDSARAYEKFLAQYKNYEFAEQVHLMLGLLYGRYLKRPEEALQQLNTAAEHLTDPGQKDLCQKEIERLQNNN
jgi:membrane associated rhomboid family serine protease